ncbi:hypothetical protein ACIOWI_32990 [Streptomyces sp. NPDC087659]|uniref:hypothetical protein n=1 Tax=Streptomyces sp. NPDC087659 TaxID=3365801 RepID=UPI0037F2AECD
MTPPANTRRRTAAAAFLDTLNGTLRLRMDAPHGACEVTDHAQPPEHRACRQQAALTVHYTDQRGRRTFVHACPTHAEPLRYLANARTGIQTAIRSYTPGGATS